MDANPPLPADDAPFKRIIVVGTTLSLGAVYGWLAGFVRQPDGDLIFHWRWLVLVWALIGLGTTAWFWRKIWPQAGRPAVTRKDIVLGSLALALPGLWWLIFPLRSMRGQPHFWEVVTGLSIAAVVLTFGAFMIFRLVKGFEEEDAEEEEYQHQKK